MRILTLSAASNSSAQAINIRSTLLSPSKSPIIARETRKKASLNNDVIGRRRSKPSASTTKTSALFFSRPTDPGDWDLSPEWYGSQGGGYGRDDGVVVYSSGDVVVTAHAASSSSSADDESENDDDQWRVLRFGEATRQSVCRVRKVNKSFRMDPKCLAFEYTKTLVALSLALLPLPVASACSASDDENSSTTTGSPPRILCVGVGGGSVPAALASLRPDARVSAFELDERVVGAWPATGLSALVEEGEGEGEAMLRNLSLHQGCGAGAVAQVAREQPGSVDLLIVDAFDNEDRVPSVFTDDDGDDGGDDDDDDDDDESSSSSFFRDAARALSPRGSVLINLHCGPRPGPAAALAALFSFRVQGGGGSLSSSPLSSSAFDTSKGEGREAVGVTKTYARNLLSNDSDSGVAFMVAARRQQNVAGVVSRGGLLALAERAEKIDVSTLAAAASAGAAACAMPLSFDVGSRANFGLVKL